MSALPSPDLLVDTQPPSAVWHGIKRPRQTAAADRPAIVDLEERIEALLRLPLRQLALPADIAKLYKERTSGGARKMMASWCAWVGWCNLPCVAFDVMILPRSVALAAVAFRVIISLMFLTGAWLLRAARLAGREHVVIIVPTLVTLLLAGTAGLLSPGHALLEHYLIFGVVIASTVITFVRLDQAHANFLAAGAIGIMIGCLGASGVQDIGLKLQDTVFYSAVMLTLLHAQRIQNIYRTRVFLANTRDDLRNSAVARRNDQLSSIAYVDPLTNIPNRRYFDEICGSIGDATKNLLPLSLCLIDVDHFKNLNDQLGHLQGDRCLRVIATAIRNNLRSNSDILARFGGEEFVLLLPGTDADGALEVMERIRIAVMALNHPNPSTTYDVVTVSAGIAVADTRPVTVETLLHNADLALYRAKSSGRNRVRL